jgi:hypothetical protein
MQLTVPENKIICELPVSTLELDECEFKYYFWQLVIKDKIITSSEDWVWVTE